MGKGVKVAGEEGINKPRRKGAGGAGLADQEVHLGGIPAFVEDIVIDLADHAVMDGPGAASDGLLGPRLAKGVEPSSSLKSFPPAGKPGGFGSSA